jgi:hypothetical protein
MFSQLSDVTFAIQTLMNNGNSGSNQRFFNQYVPQNAAPQNSSNNQQNYPQSFYGQPIPPHFNQSNVPTTQGFHGQQQMGRSKQT